ncbi:uncharacterized protein LOC125659715 isoform X2 [Ostrea edulis]|uniref:uncharacterized protein LOC125659715 isoform X2 n=1 Tax=Ostrea edulis TaxID=37623 RepID=UPI00209645DD|nr:uncharacterized protein LOC125659715 isoform X2 [Ostrea edulis]
MEFLKVLVVLFVVFHGSLSKPIGSDDELRVIVGQLERLVGSLRRLVDYVDMPEYSSIEPRSESTPEFPVPGARMLGKLLRPHFASFPVGPYTLEMPLTQHDIVEKLSAWYRSDQVMFRERAFGNIAGELLNAHFQCATTKLNQIVFYVLKQKSHEMTNEQNMNMHVREILESSFLDTANVNNVVQRIVSAAQSYTYGQVIDHLGRFQLQDIEEFLGKMKMLMRRAEQNKWSPVMFDEKLNHLLTDHEFVFKCPSMNDLWRFHQEIASRFQERFPVTKPLTETEAWLTEVLPTYMTTDATPAITAILKVYTDFVKSVMFHLKEVENHMGTGNTADITNFMSKYLAPHKLQYLQSVFEILNSNVIKINTETLRPSNTRCTDFNGRCE